MITSMTKALEKELLWSEEELNKKSKMKNEGAGLLILGIGVLAMGIANHFLPVSYTHLDVYKRQTWSLALNFCST